jgi:hypothetical protein
MLQAFYLDIAYVLQWLQMCFPSVSNVVNILTVLDICCKVFHLDIAKLDLVLHMLRWDPLAIAACYSCWARVHARGSGGGMSGRRGKWSDTTTDWVIIVGSRPSFTNSFGPRH